MPGMVVLGGTEAEAGARASLAPGRAPGQPWGNLTVGSSPWHPDIGTGLMLLASVGGSG